MCQKSNINYDNMIFISVERFPHSLDGRCYISGIIFLMCYFCDDNFVPYMGDCGMAHIG